MHETDAFMTNITPSWGSKFAVPIISKDFNQVVVDWIEDLVDPLWNRGSLETLS